MFEGSKRFKSKLESSVIKNMSLLMALVLLLNMVIIPIVTPNNSVQAAEEATVKVTSLGKKGTVTIGTKTKKGTWYKMTFQSKKAFCMNLGKACHNGNTYELEDTKSWNQSTGGEYYGYYAKIIRWYVVDRDRKDKAYVLSQALIWSVQEGKNSEENLKSVITQVKNNTGYFPKKTADDLYKDIFSPEGAWTVTATIWKKKGGSASYQRLLAVDAGVVPDCNFISDSTYYRQRITLNKKDEFGNPLSGVQFTLSAHNLDDLYGFSINDASGYQTPDDYSDDTEFVSTGITRDDGRIVWRMSYWITTREYAYYGDTKLANMTADEKKAAKKHLTDDLGLDEGVDFGSNMTKKQAQDLMDAELNAMRQEVANTYTLTENSTNRKDMVINNAYGVGINYTLGYADSWERSNGVWPDNQEAVPADYAKAKQVTVYNDYKKVRLRITKADNYSSDGKAHGDATLDGAVFGIYTNQECTKKPVFYTANSTTSTDNEFETVNGTFLTEYLQVGKTYYIKELKAPTGYKLKTDIIPVSLDANDYTQSLEYQPTIKEITIEEEPVLSKLEIEKTWFDPDNHEEFPEKGATFQVYLRSRGSYEACSEYERDTLVMDENGYACSKDLYYGTYIVHQVNTGGIDSIMIKDEPIVVKDDGKPIEFSKTDELFKAYLKIIKKDSNTGESVLKSNTKFKIYQVKDSGEEVLVEQEYVDGTETKTISEFETDETGEVMTAQSLVPGNYRIYEIDSASGLHMTKEFVPFEVNSKANNYTSFKDEEGYEHALITVDYENQETYGKLKIFKYGEMLSGFENGKFVYTEQPLKGVEFEVYADGDILTQDNQGTKWYEDGELVATVTSGQGAEFTKRCKNITGYSLGEDGTVTINLPLGKYKVKEKKTVYGYIRSNAEWPVELNWQNMNDEYVINSTDSTDDNGILSVLNERVLTSVSLLKTDALSKQGLEGVVFGVYSKDAIYNANGDEIVSAEQKLGTVTTDKDGKAVAAFDFPLMSEKYDKDNKEEKLNSGDYYLKEEGVSGSYYLDDKELPIHLEYSNDETPVISVEVSHENTQTEVQIDKTAVTGSEELLDCHLQISDEAGNVIASWISGVDADVALNPSSEYQNLSSVYTQDKHRIIRGLLHNTTYTLTETYPADGYLTAQSITFQLVESKDEPGRTLVSIQAKDGTFAPTDGNVVHMVDEQTVVVFEKLTKEQTLLGGAKIEVYNSKDEKVTEFVTTENQQEVFTGLFKLGETYTFKEVETPAGYVTAQNITFQLVESKDEPGKTFVSIQAEDGTFVETGDNKIQMVDDQTTVVFKKQTDKGELLEGAKIEVYNSQGEKITEFVTTNQQEVFTGLFTAGETYTFVEAEAPEGYLVADYISYTIEDTEAEQVIVMTDKRFGTIITRAAKNFFEGQNTYGSPKTGDSNNVFMWLGLLLLSAIILGAIGLAHYKKGRTANEKD